MLSDADMLLLALTEGVALVLGEPLSGGEGEADVVLLPVLDTESDSDGEVVNDGVMLLVALTVSVGDCDQVCVFVNVPLGDTEADSVADGDGDGETVADTVADGDVVALPATEPDELAVQELLAVALVEAVELRVALDDAVRLIVADDEVVRLCVTVAEAIALAVGEGDADKE